MANITVVVQDNLGRTASQVVQTTVTQPPASFAPRFLVGPYTPSSPLSTLGDAAIVDRAGQDGVIIIQTSMITAGRVATLRAEAAARGFRQQIWLYELPQQPGTWMSFYAEADSHEDWWLHSATPISRSNRIKRADRQGVLDFNNVACRTFIINHIATWIEQYGLDGYFNDEPGYIISGLSGWNVGPTSAQRAAHLAGNAIFAEEMRVRLGSKQFWWNAFLLQFTSDPASSGYDTEVDSPEGLRIRAVLNGFMAEGAYHNPGNCVDWTAGEWTLQNQMNLVENRRAAGKRANIYTGTMRSKGPKDASGNCSGPLGTTAEYLRWRDLGFACYLLTAQPGEAAYFSWQDKGWFDHRPLIAMNIGDPLGPRQKINGVWVREFTRMTVKANLDPAAAHDGVPAQSAIFIPK